MHSIVFVWGYQTANYAYHSTSLPDSEGILYLLASRHINRDSFGKFFDVDRRRGYTGDMEHASGACLDFNATTISECTCREGIIC